MSRLEKRKMLRFQPAFSEFRVRVFDSLNPLLFVSILAFFACQFVALWALSLSSLSFSFCFCEAFFLWMAFLVSCRGGNFRV
jgi:hypothetical protein